MTRILLLITALFLLAIVPVVGQRTIPASKEELAAITQRGRLLFEYDAASAVATDAALATAPRNGAIKRYIAQKTANGWTVAFGRLNDKQDAFLLACEVSVGAKPQDLKVAKFDPPKVSDYYLRAA